MCGDSKTLLKLSTIKLYLALLDLYPCTADIQVQLASVACESYIHLHSSYSDPISAASTDNHLLSTVWRGLVAHGPKNSSDWISETLQEETDSVCFSSFQPELQPLTSANMMCLAGKKAGKQPTLSAYLLKTTSAAKGKASSSQPSRGKPVSGNSPSTQ